MPNESTKKTESAPKVLVKDSYKNPPPWGYFIVGLILLVGSLFLLAKTYQKTSQVTFNNSNTIVKVKLAQTDKQIEKGLSGQKNLGKNQGMLFVLQKDTKPEFWMKDMKFPLDFIWLKDDGTVSWITPNVSPDSYPQKFQPPKPIKYVLEVNTGFAAEYHIRKGDTSSIQL